VTRDALQQQRQQQERRRRLQDAAVVTSLASGTSRVCSYDRAERRGFVDESAPPPLVAMTTSPPACEAGAPAPAASQNVTIGKNKSAESNGAGELANERAEVYMTGRSALLGQSARSVDE